MAPAASFSIADSSFFFVDEQNDTRLRNIAYRRDQAENRFERWMFLILTTHGLAEARHRPIIVSGGNRSMFFNGKLFEETTIQNPSHYISKGHGE